MRPALLASLVLCVGVGASVALLLNGATPERIAAPVLIAYMAVLLAAASAISHARAPALGPLNPAFLLFGYLMLLYVARPLYTLLDGSVGTPPVGYTEVSSISMEYVATLALLAVGLSLFVALFFAAPSLLDRVLTAPREPRRAVGRAILIVLLGLGTALALVTIRELAASPGGWQSALTVRNRFFEGRSALVWGMELYKFAFLAWLALTVRAHHRISPGHAISLIALWLPTVAFDLIGGSRAELLLRNIVPAAAILMTAVSPSRSIIGRYALVGLAVVVVFVGYRTVVREQVYASQGMTPIEALTENFRDLGRFVFGGDEVAGFDLLVITRVEVPRYVSHRGAETLLVLAEAPIPRGWLDYKPERGGHALTSALRPTIYARGVNPAFSGAADLYYTGGDVAMVAGLGAIGFTAGLLLLPVTRRVRERSTQSAWPVAFGFTATAALISVIRADLLEAAFLPIRVGAITLLYMAMSRASR